LLFLAEKTGIVDFFFVAESSERLQSHIDTHLSWSRFKTFRLTLARKADVPFTSRGTLHGTGFHLAFDLAMIDHLEAANLGEAYPFIMCDAKATLREGEAIISLLAFEARIARVLGMLSHSTKESLKGQINTDGYILQDLGVNSIERSAFLFQNREGILLLKTGERDAIPFIGRFTHFKQVVIEPTTLFKGLVELLFLLLIGKDAVRKHFQHSVIGAQTEQECKPRTALSLPRIRNAPYIPISEERGFTARFGNNKAMNNEFVGFARLQHPALPVEARALLVPPVLLER
jgi:hypothetical protein